MKNVFADLHIHSYYSDGTMSPRQILDLAKERNVGLIAISDHDTFEGSVELMKICDKSGIKCIPAVEITTIDKGHQIHVLGYNPDFTSDRFRSFVAHGRKELDKMSITLINKLHYDGKAVSVEEYEAYPDDRTLGGWKALRYIVDSGIAKDKFEGMRLYPENGVGYETADFSDTETAIKEIISAGGAAIIAHPGLSVPKDSFTDDLERYISYGASGAECYYSEYDEETTQRCLDFCKNRNLNITCGSDFHGTFLSRELGTPQISTEDLVLNKII